MSIYDELEHFRPEEFDHPDEVSELLLLQLEAARDIAGLPFYITSDYRPGDPRAHGRGNAVDFRLSPRPAPISGRARWTVTRALLAASFRRIGLYDRHIHVDVDEELPQDVIWIGESQ